MLTEAIRKSGALVALGAAAAMLAATGARANTLSRGTVMLRYHSCSPRQAADLSIRPGHWLTGMYNLQLDPTYDPDLNGVPGKGEGEQFHAFAQDNLIGAFCADAYQNASTSYAVYDVYRPEDANIGGITLGAAKAADLRKLFFNYSGLVQTPPTGWSQNDAAAAFQAAVWEVVNEPAGEYDTRTGSFWMQEYWGSGWLNLANTWLSGLSSLADPMIGLRVLVNPSTQDYAFSVPTLGTQPPVPEPLTVAGVLAGLAGLGAYLRRRRLA